MRSRREGNLTKSFFLVFSLIMYYKIINLLVHIKLPEHFIFVEAEQVRYTRQTSAIIKNVDKTLINVILDQPVEDLGIVFLSNNGLMEPFTFPYQTSHKGFHFQGKINYFSVGSRHRLA